MRSAGSGIESSRPVACAWRTRDGHRIDEEHLAIETPWTRLWDGGHSTWIVTIDNGDDRAAEDLQSVRLEMVARKLCFDAAAGASYALLHGDGSLSAPLYDYAKLFMPEPDALSGDARARGCESSEFEVRPDTRPFTEKHPGCCGLCWCWSSSCWGRGAADREGRRLRNVPQFDHPAGSYGRGICRLWRNCICTLCLVTPLSFRLWVRLFQSSSRPRSKVSAIL